MYVQSCSVWKDVFDPVHQNICNKESSESAPLCKGGFMERKKQTDLESEKSVSEYAVSDC